MSKVLIINQLMNINKLNIKLIVKIITSIVERECKK